MIDLIRFILSLCLTVFGLFVLLSGVVGIFRFKEPLRKIHAAGLFDTLGILSMLLGVIIAVGPDIASVKMVLIILILWITSPVASHLIARMEVSSGQGIDPPEAGTRQEGKEDEPS